MDRDEMDAGDFSSWLVEVRAAIRGERASEVACGSCTGCCTSSQFVHIDPDETDALAHIPSELLFPAPLAPKGTKLMGYDERGHCPMLVDGKCSIYEHRPRTCRTYDCRVFAAAGIRLADPDKRAIAERANRWVFRHPTPDDDRAHAAVRRAAAWLASDGEDGRPRSDTQRAVEAIAVHEEFLET